jgi:hypothetical protein
MTVGPEVAGKETTARALALQDECVTCKTTTTTNWDLSTTKTTTCKPKPYK